MVEHDEMVGKVLKKLDDLGIADNTIVIYSTDNGAEKLTWPDGGTTPFFGEKGTTWEGGFRVPLLVRWPGTIKPGTVYNNIISHEDWMPTLLAAAGDPNVVQKVAEGYKLGDKTFKQHLDGYNFLPFFQGKEDKSPCHEIFYFDQGGNLNAVRYDDWKVKFAITEGAINTAYRKTPAWPVIVNLRADPFESPRFRDVHPLVRRPALDLRANAGASHKVRRNSQGLSAGNWRLTEWRSEL